MCNKENNCCCALGIISSLLAAVGIAVAVFAGLITGIITLVYITLIVAILSLLLVLFLAICGRDGCHCIKNNCLLTTSIVSIIASAFGLAATTLAAASIPVAILIGVIAFFLINNLIEIVKYILCLLCNRECR